MHVEIMPYSICLPSLVLIAQVVFLLECGHTHMQTDIQSQMTADKYRLLPAWVIKETRLHGSNALAASRNN